jgi:hypothetical protein
MTGCNAGIALVDQPVALYLREGRYKPVRRTLCLSPGFTSASLANYLLLCVALLFVIFQTPLIRSRLRKSIHPSDLPEA